MVTFHTQSGCALSALTGHAVAGEQGVHAEVPFAYVPVGQFDAVKGHDDAPWMLYEPKAQGWQTADELAPIMTEKDPAAQGVQTELVAAPTKEL